LIKRDEASLEYLWPSVVLQLEKHTPMKNRMYANLLLHYLHEVTFERQIGCMSIDLKIDKFVKQVPKNEDGYILYNHFIYFYQSRNSHEKVNELLNEMPNIGFKLDKKVEDFYQHLTKHLLKLSDESTYLNDPKNIVTSSLSWVYEPLGIDTEIKDIK